MRPLALAAALLSFVALARSQKPCADKCADSNRECVTICKESGPPKMKPYCKTACDMGEKQCLKKCAAKK